MPHPREKFLPSPGKKVCGRPWDLRCNWNRSYWNQNYRTQSIHQPPLSPFTSFDNNRPEPETQEYVNYYETGRKITLFSQTCFKGQKSFFFKKVGKDFFPISGQERGNSKKNFFCGFQHSKKTNYEIKFTKQKDLFFHCFFYLEFIIQIFVLRGETTKVVKMLRNMFFDHWASIPYGD